MIEINIFKLKIKLYQNIYNLNAELFWVLIIKKEVSQRELTSEIYTPFISFFFLCVICKLKKKIECSKSKEISTMKD